MNTYRKRIVDDILELKLEALGAVLIEGPKACGKTTTAEQIAKSILYMADPELEQQNLQLAKTDIKKLLVGEPPLLIDEWQLAPRLWDAIRFEIDHRREEGQFILTGSAVPPKTDEIKHSGAGRFGWVTMRPMSLWESGESNGEVSLQAIFNGESNVYGKNSISLDNLAFLLCRGGWPQSITKKSERAALLIAQEYVDTIVRTDISRVDNVQRNPDWARRLLRSYARHQGTSATINTIIADLSANERMQATENTVSAYISALRKIFVIEDMISWNPNLRSKSAIRTSDTRYFVDASVAAAALGVAPNDLISDLNTFGLLFETMAMRDLRVYADALDGNVSHFRDRTGLECDAVLHLRNGSYGLIEIKLGGDNLIEEGVRNLNKLENLIDVTRMKAPSFKMVLTGIGQIAYRRSDG
ncbi:MAG: DUF4143 domain-containing protein, partial [Bacteroidaceae bacterium]|nr:DUF4143 domain-containing protein [Bacteroidaceae bacterium]